MIQNEKQLKKIIKETISFKNLLKESPFTYAADNSFGTYGMGNFNGGNSFLSSKDANRNNNTSSIKIDNAIETGEQGARYKNDPKLIKKNQIIISSIFQILECQSSDFTEFYKKSFTKSEINQDFLDEEDTNLEYDKEAIGRFLKKWLKDLNSQNAQKNQEGQYNAAYVNLKSSLSNYFPKWTVLWCLFKEINQILDTDKIMYNIINNDSCWEMEILNSGYKIYALRNDYLNKLKQALITIINKKIKITANDINEAGSDIFNTEFGGMGDIIKMVLQFFFGDDVLPIVDDLRGIFESDFVKNLTSEQTEELKEELKNDPVAQKIVNGEAENIKKEELNTFRDKAKSITADK